MVTKAGMPIMMSFLIKPNRPKLISRSMTPFMKAAMPLPTVGFSSTGSILGSSWPLPTGSLSASLMSIILACIMTMPPSFSELKAFSNMTH
eukprot:CAMPEP_0201283286 /NCGR_PEP_ID=MMETSP1317-20130820/8153_1 /ASSEMBLY_ACC=CAM_ASM_000770 /TAXON_ID=187299 /ORGANISM="Undescribed Undescribed, Strain Undescribed" /LENGTH=90 /DNA_ID=CAMNT_0047599011 /DNA_START=76 /DNA_END=348 /DNA_ORIENTATION=-